MKTFKIETQQISTIKREYFIDAESENAAKIKWNENSEEYLNDDTTIEGGEIITSTIETDSDGNELKAAPVIDGNAFSSLSGMGFR